MDYVGIDIGSTSAKAVVRGAHNDMRVIPIGWSAKEAAAQLAEWLESIGVDVNAPTTCTYATGYGRAAVSFARKTPTEITCHATGAAELIAPDCMVIDVGGQDTKVIVVSGGKVEDFLMNDKCSAGTGKFIEVMAARLGVDLGELFEMAAAGTPVKISSLCTVFAESEIIGHIGEGEDRHNIAAGIVCSVAEKVSTMTSRFSTTGTVALTGGLSNNPLFARTLSEKMKVTVTTVEHGQFAGALGAALLAEKANNS